MVLAALSAALVLAAAPVRVESESCPSGAEVEQALVSMLPPVPDATRPDVARVIERGKGLQIELVNPDAAVIAERALDMDGSCADLAAAVAVVIATWESDVHSEFSRSRAEAGFASVAERTPERLATPLSRPSASYDVAAGPSLSLAGTFVAGGALVGTWVPLDTGLGLRLFAAGESSRTVDLGVGQARWRRWAGSAESDWRLARHQVMLDVHAGLVLGWLTATGAGFSQNQSQRSFSPGGTVGMRSSWWAARHLAVCLDLVGLYWSRSQTLYGDPTVTRRNLPHFQGLASIGLAWGQMASSR